MSWRDTAQDAIACFLLETEAQCLLLGEPIDLQKALCEISKSKYPFAWKGGHAYKSWLAAIKWTKQRVEQGLSPSEISRIDWKSFDRENRSKGEVDPNQLTLFGAS